MSRGERYRNRLAELMKRNHGPTIAKARLYRERRRNADRYRAATVRREQNQLIRQEHAASRRSVARKASRRAMNAMRKTVEIADGSSDFFSLMAATFGHEIMRSWKYADEVFEDITGLRLIQETEDDEEGLIQETEDDKEGEIHETEDDKEGEIHETEDYEEGEIHETEDYDEGEIHENEDDEEELIYESGKDQDS